MVFTKAGPAEILRATQKDEFAVKELQGDLNEVLLHAGGARLALHYKSLLEATGYFLYYGNTTLAGLQTLGEEYTGILQVDNSLRSVPRLMSRTVMLILDFFGPSAVKRFFSVMERTLNNNPDLRPEAKSHVLALLSVMKSMLPFIGLIHRALFYCNWGTYHLAKRFTGINYVLVRSWLKNKESLYGFRVLGLITMLQLMVFSMSSAYNWLVSYQPSPRKKLGTEAQGLEENEELCSIKCSLCLELMRSVSSTPCGHLFCWACIHEWLQNQEKCPICREAVNPSRVIPLRNFT